MAKERLKTSIYRVKLSLMTSLFFSYIASYNREKSLDRNDTFTILHERRLEKEKERRKSLQERYNRSNAAKRFDTRLNGHSYFSMNPKATVNTREN